MAVLSSSTLTLSQAEARIQELEAKLASRAKVSYKVSQKGAISIYGMGRFPVTLYLSQFNALAAALPGIQAWIKTNPRHVDPVTGKTTDIGLASKAE